MNARKNPSLWILLLALAGSICAAGQTQPSGISTATIISSGSTNKDSYRIVLTRSGDASFTREPGDKTEMTKQSTITSKIAMDLTNKFFHDLTAAMPVSGLPEEPCAKQDTLSSTTYV